MIKTKKSYFFPVIFFAAVAAIFALSATTVKADTFNPNFIVSDAELLDSSAMGLPDIENFLQQEGSYLAYYACPNFQGIKKTAAEIIYDAAVNNYDCDGVPNGNSLTAAQKELECKKITLNPKVLLVLLQKEQSLIENPSPSQSQLDWATGYGCPDGQSCSPRWQGFGRQVNSAAMQFFDYMQHPELYTYRAGNTYTVSNTNLPPMQITPVNQATAALYNYTPHVYNGNFNFYNLWMKYFTFSYPNNTLLQVKGQPGVWVIQNGVKRPILSKSVLESRYDPKKILQVSQSDINRYPTGTALKFPQYSLIRSPHGTIYLLVDDIRRGFTSMQAFRNIGYNPAEVINASWDDINAYTEGEPITATTSYPTGALLQDKSTGGVYWVSNGTKAPLWDPVLLKTKFKGKSITPVDPKKLADFKTVQPAIFSDGELLKSNTDMAVYVIDNGKRRPITSAAVFEGLGYKWENIITVPQKILDLYPEGEPINEIYNSEPTSGSGLTGTSTPAALATGTPEIATGTPGIATSTPESMATETSPTTGSHSATSSSGTSPANNSQINKEVNEILNPLGTK